MREPSSMLFREPAGLPYARPRPKQEEVGHMGMDAVETSENVLAGWEMPADEILSVLAPYIAETIAADSDEGRLLIGQRRNNLLHLTLKGALALATGGRRQKTGSLVKDHYDHMYSGAKFSGYAPLEKKVVYRLGDRLLQMDASGVKRAIMLVIEKIVERLNPQSICEVGCGSGRNVMYLASRFPEIRYSGFDLSENGVAVARGQKDRTDLDLRLPDRPGPLDEASRGAVAKIEFFQSSADRIAAPDKAFDLVFSCAALEQMSAILPAVLKEIRRVTKRYVVFAEPFAEFNDVYARLFLWSGNYFRARMGMMRDHGLEPLGAFNVLPCKPTFRYGIFVGRVVD